MSAGWRLGAAIGTVASCVFTASGGLAMSSEQQRICAEAEKRYQQIFGKPSSDEPFLAILMFNNTFCPPEVTVKQGAKVRWINVDRRTSHSVWFKSAGQEETDRVFPEDSVEMTIDLPPGEYPYLCGPHWESDKMVGRMTVTGN